MTGTLALLPTMLQNLMNYPALTTGLITAPRGVGSMAAMFLVAPLINRIDNRLIILVGLLLITVAMWQMSGFSLQMGMAPIVVSGLLQGFGLGFTQVPLNIIALSTLPPPHSDPRDGDPQRDTQSRRQHRHQRFGRNLGPEYS